MPTQENRSVSSTDKQKHDIPHLTDAYQRARRNLTLASGILLAWEYVGVQVGTSTAELPLAKTPVNLLNPEVLPQVISLIVVYFAIRLGTEWCQCDLVRRENWASRIDLFLAGVLAILAIALFIFQSLSDIRAAEILKPESAMIILVGFALTSICGRWAHFGLNSPPLKHLVIEI